MMQLTARDVHAHQAEVPWPSLLQVEQDLLLCRAMAALFADKFLHEQLAMRGGTLLHNPPSIVQPPRLKHPVRLPALSKSLGRSARIAQPSTLVPRLPHETLRPSTSQKCQQARTGAFD